ncbi:GtrA family protein [Mycolicibacterium sp. XJ870]
MIPLSRKRFLLWRRYAGASVVAGIISEVVFLVTYWLSAVPVLASLLAFIAGAVPNYLMNRYWAWQRRGRPHGTREILPYIVIIVVTALTAIVVTTVADHWVRDHVAAHGWQVALVGAAFLATYGAMFVLKFVLFDRFIFVDRAADTPDTTSAP